MSLQSLKDKAHAEIAKIEDAAVREYLTLKTKSISVPVAIGIVVAAFILGFIA